MQHATSLPAPAASPAPNEPNSSRRAALAAERATATSQVKAARNIAATIAPADRWDKIAADAAEAERRLPAALLDAEERDRQALTSADKTLDRIDTQQGQLTRRGAAITTEQERRRDLTPEQAATDATQRSRADSEKGAASPQERERNNRAMMLARQREQTEQQKQRDRGMER
ncbi:hypothetical protein [Rhodococcus sp. ARC_M6]|uniref:hypothetical protein n=1 Tax=Rhodococcus sp. ARC_M6 TaxID=2928852 RepID=UPI001FB1DD98|nr:hypothetical protein [Rhodococcus sp. ARC_M6]MCJ0902435.1 hypothetical protein [Rhodococcus sp. ARC_M6]